MTHTAEHFKGANNSKVARAKASSLGMSNASQHKRAGSVILSNKHEHDQKYQKFIS